MATASSRLGGASCVALGRSRARPYRLRLLACARASRPPHSSLSPVGAERAPPAASSLGWLGAQFPITAIREIKILKILNHKNVVRLKEIVTSKGADYNQGKGSIYMVMEFCDHDLTGLTDAGQRFTVPQIKCYMKQLLEGLAYCHNQKVLHRDIKGAPPAPSHAPRAPPALPSAFAPRGPCACTVLTHPCSPIRSPPMVARLEPPHQQRGAVEARRFRPRTPV